MLNAADAGASEAAVPVGVCRVFGSRPRRRLSQVRRVESAESTLLLAAYDAPQGGIVCRLNSIFLMPKVG